MNGDFILLQKAQKLSSPIQVLSKSALLRIP